MNFPVPYIFGTGNNFELNIFCDIETLNIILFQTIRNACEEVLIPQIKLAGVLYKRQNIFFSRIICFS